MEIQAKSASQIRDEVHAELQAFTQKAQDLARDGGDPQSRLNEAVLELAGFTSDLAKRVIDLTITVSGLAALVDQYEVGFGDGFTLTDS